jgi:ubiquinone/menaquinone biosynthesis C-methylase UbiE
MWDPAWLRAVAELEPVRAGKRRSYELLAIGPGQSVLDVGAGAGDDLRALTELVSPGGRVVGVDSSPGSAEVQLADACALPFDDDTFDACRCDRTLQHVADPQKALAEMVRVTRPGGVVLISEVRYRSPGGAPASPRALEFGLMLPVFIQQSGLTEIGVERVAGRLGEHELETYLFYGKKPCTPRTSAIQT